MNQTNETDQNAKNSKKKRALSASHSSEIKQLKEKQKIISSLQKKVSKVAQGLNILIWFDFVHRETIFCPNFFQ